MEPAGLHIISAISLSQHQRRVVDCKWRMRARLRRRCPLTLEEPPLSSGGQGSGGNGAARTARLPEQGSLPN